LLPEYNVEENQYFKNPQNLSKTESFADFIYRGGIPEANNLLLENIVNHF